MAWWEHVELEVAAIFAMPPLWDRIAQGLEETRHRELSRKRTYASVMRHNKRQEMAPCPGCGKPFDNHSRGWLRSYCSDACRVTMHNRKQTEARRAALGAVREYTCTHCGGTFTRPTRGGMPPKYCKRSCRDKANKQ